MQIKKKSKPGTLNAAEQVAIVDESNQVIGAADRAVMRKFALPHRATSILIWNSKGQVLCQKRTMLKDYCPGMLDPFTGGVVACTESFHENAIRELEEEMGITNVSLTKVDVFYYQDERCKVFSVIFECVYDGDLEIQEEEVEDVVLLTPEEIFQRQSEFTPDGIASLQHYLDRKRAD